MIESRCIPFLLGDLFAAGVGEAQARRYSDLLDLPPEQQSLFRAGFIERALDARRAGIDDRDTSSHRPVSLRWCRKTFSGDRRGCARVRRDAATRTATAQEARRVSAASARLVRMIGTRAPSTIPAASAPLRNDMLFASMLPGFKVRHDQHVGAAGDRRDNLLDRRGLGTDRIVERQRAVEQAAGDLPAVRHLAQGRGLDGRGHLGVDGFHRAEDRDADFVDAHRVGQVDRVLHDVDLDLQGRSDVDRRVGDDQGIGVVWARP